MTFSGKARSIWVLISVFSVSAPGAGQLGSLQQFANSGAAQVNWISAEAVVDKSATPGDVSLAPASVVSIARLETLDTADFIGGMERSPDGKVWYYTRDFVSKPGQAERHELVARELASGKVLRIYPMGGSMEAIALDPAGSKLLIYSYRKNTLAVLGLNDGRILELPLYAPQCAQCAVLWNDPNEVYFVSRSDPQRSAWRVDLESLQAHSLSPQSKENAALVQRLLQQRYEVNKEGQRFRILVKDGALGVADNADTYWRVLLPDMYEMWLPSPDLRAIIIVDWKSNSGHRLVKATLGRRPEPRLVFKIAFEPALLGADLAVFQKLQASGRGIFGTVGSGKVNPLSGKVVGGDGSDRGTVRLRLSADQSWEVEVVSELNPIQAGHGIWYLWSEGWADRGPNLRFKPEGFFLPLQ